MDFSYCLGDLCFVTLNLMTLVKNQIMKRKTLVEACKKWQLDLVVSREDNVIFGSMETKQFFLAFLFLCTRCMESETFQITPPFNLIRPTRKNAQRTDD